MADQHPTDFSMIRPPRPARRGRTAAAALAGLALCGAAGLTACTDVTVAPRSAIGSANAFADPTAYRALLAKAYSNLALSSGQGGGTSDIQGIDAGFSQYLRLLWQMEELPTDEAVIAWGDGPLQELNTQIWTSNNSFLSAMYYRVQLQATYVNDLLRQTTDAQLTARGVSADLRAQIQTYRAEARFLRALSYWHAIDLFGGVPLVTEETPIGGAAPAQTSRADLYAFVVSELTAIRPTLPAPNRSDATQYGRATQAAVDMLLAKLYLNAAVYTGAPNYAGALAAAQRVIGSNAYALDPNYQRMFLADNNTSPELIFVVPQDGARTQNFGGTTFLVHAAIGNALNDSASTSFGVNGGWYGLRVKPEFVSLFPGSSSTTADRRGTILYGRGQSLNIASLTDFGQGYMAPKYRNVTSTGAPGSDPTFADTDYPMFRLGDAYLTYAEAFLRGGGGDQATALGYVNALRTRAGAPPITAAQLTLDFLLDERARELFWEGHRRTDLVRYGRFAGATKLWQWKGNVQAGTATDAKYNLYPLPASELIVNPGLAQNPGY